MSVVDSAGRHALMAEPASDRNPLETLGLAGIGALALVTQHADELASEIASRLGVEVDEVRTAVGDVVASWRREAERLGETGGAMASRAASELGTASREAVEELELRVAQLEHRIRLLERD